MESILQAVTGFITANAMWAGPAMFVVCFGESFVFVSLVVPGTSILFVAGALLPSGTLPFVPVVLGAVAGAVAGDGVSYWMGRKFGPRLVNVWPFRGRPELFGGGVALFKKHGAKSVFIGRFFGPARAIVPLAAGLLDMPPPRFWTANILSAILWAPAILAPAALLGDAAKRIAAEEELVLGALMLLMLLSLGGAWILSRLRF
jgi:membrane protein DedA with SNARE-associated domain